MKYLLIFVIVNCYAVLFAANGASTWPTDLKCDFLSKVSMKFVNGVVKNTEATALPDIDAKYSKIVKVDGIIFDLPGEICENTSACYRADFNGDRVPDYLFVSVKVWNGRFTGRYDAAVYVSTPDREFELNVFEGQFLEAFVKNGQKMIAKYDYSDDKISLIREVYRFEKSGRISLQRAEKFSF